MEGLLSTGPTPSSFLHNLTQLSKAGEEVEVEGDMANNPEL